MMPVWAWRLGLPLLLAAVGGLAGCGLGDTDVTECRCGEDTDVAAFPKCLN